MRVLHINSNYITTALHQTMIEHLNAYDIDNKVFVPTWDKSKAIVDCKDYVTISECFKKWNRFLFNYKQNKIIEAAQENYQRNDFDLIHAYTLFTDGNVALELSKKWGVPYVVAIRNTDLNVFFKYRKNLSKKGLQILLNASKVFFLSESYKNTLFSKYIPKKYRGSIEDKAIVVPNGIDDFWLKNEPKLEKSIDLNAIRLIFVGRIDSNKNIIAIQDAMSLLRQEGINSSLTVVGKIFDPKVFDRLLSDSYTSYISPQIKEKLIHIYRSNDIFVMPSLFESFGLVYAEAMSQGLPVIYTKGQGFDGQFEEGIIGYHVNPRDTEDIASAIKRVIYNYDTIQRNTTNLAKRFDWDGIAFEYTNIYNQILASNK